MLVKAVQLGSSRCGGRIPMADSPRGARAGPTHEAPSRPPLRSFSVGAPLMDGRIALGVCSAGPGEGPERP
eukprot:10924507-Alexandrium_andersonii.AAC.1